VRLGYFPGRPQRIPAINNKIGVFLNNLEMFPIRSGPALVPRLAGDRSSPRVKL
jgi:hypothetical protein